MIRNSLGKTILRNLDQRGANWKGQKPLWVLLSKAMKLYLNISKPMDKYKILYYLHKKENISLVLAYYI
jgi:hypothetical protein